MPDTCVLRFRDIEGDDTVQKHRQLISASGSVWWGWWKKLAEPDRWREIEELQDKARKEALSVGLFDYSTPSFFVANMVDCVVTKGERVLSPDARQTPSYASEKRCPAWFRFAAIEEVTAAEFEERFGPPPSGDGTFFPIWRDRSRASLKLSDPIKASRPSILHLSDIHFGTDFGFPQRSGPGQTPLLDVIERDLRDDPPGLIVVSGDITSRADANVLQNEGLRFLRALSDALKVPKECFVIVPGNHDIALQNYAPTDYSHEAAYNLFTKEFFGREMKCPELRRFGFPNGRTIELLAMNSVRLRHKAESQFGYVQWRLYDDALRLTERNPDDFRIAVLHHHLVPASREERTDPNYKEAAISVTLDAGAVVEGLQSNGFKLALHGHQHVPAIARIDRGSPVGGKVKLSEDGGMVVLAAGSAGATRLSDEMRDNSYNVIKLLDKGYSVEAKRFNPAKAPEILFQSNFD
ncbi:putative MPP superfamily phosphohydrolase [Bradyrhizobium sp. F1.4.3]|uniref:metallophosphoesterase family protein n=1 Tax=Bradyrhizobium sp. F1.4.3 TaxID=3156356 RepID=UPI0033924EE1